MQYCTALRNAIDIMGRLASVLTIDWSRKRSARIALRPYNRFLAIMMFNNPGQEALNPGLSMLRLAG